MAEPKDPRDPDGTQSAVAPGDEPLRLLEGDTGDRLLIYTTSEAVAVDLRVSNDTFWATQQQMAEMFGVKVPAISKHLKNIFEEGELDPGATLSKMEIVQTEGNRQVRREVEVYNLNAIISVGYRVGGKLGTMFRIWATDRLVQLLTKGFVIDDERLKNPDGRPDFFDELLDRIRDIRSSEARMWTRVLEMASFCNDYNADDKKQHITFFAEIQNTMHWAVSQHTAAEIVHARVDANVPNAGLTNFSGKMPTVKEAQTAKNFLAEGEITALNLITSLTLEFSRARRNNDAQLRSPNSSKNCANWCALMAAR